MKLLRGMADRTKAKVVYFSLDGKNKDGIYSDEKSIYINCLGYNEKLWTLTNSIFSVVIMWKMLWQQ